PPLPWQVRRPSSQRTHRAQCHRASRWRAVAGLLLDLAAPNCSLSAIAALIPRAKVASARALQSYRSTAASVKLGISLSQIGSRQLWALRTPGDPTLLHLEGGGEHCARPRAKADGTAWAAARFSVRSAPRRPGRRESASRLS